MKTLSIVWGIILIAIFTLLTIFAMQYKNKLADYHAKENEIKQNVVGVFEQHWTYPNYGEHLKISFSELKELGLINDVEVNNDQCDGYVLVKNDEVVNFQVMMKCSKYVSNNYNNY